MPPFVDVQHQGQLTPLQKQVIAKTLEHNREQREERMEQAQNGNGPSMQKNGAYDKKKQMLEEQYGGEDKSYTNKDFDPDKSLIMDEDEVLHRQ